MQRLWPLPAAAIDQDALEELYAYPDVPSWLSVSMVSSLDGAVEVEGRSAALSTPADRRVFALAHDLADVVLLGSGTAVAEQYPGLRPDATSAARRERHGLAPVPPLAVVTGSGSLAADEPSVRDVLVPTIVITCAATGEERCAAWRAAGAEVLLVGDERVDLDAALRGLAARGLRRVDCEGGPGLVGALLADGLVDELRVSLAPLAVAGGAGRIATSPQPLPSPAGFTLASALLEDSTLLLRYRR